MRSLLHRFDTCFTARIQAWPRWLYRVMKIASLLGYPYVTLGIVATSFLVIGWMFGDVRYVYAGGVIFATHGVGSFLKMTIGRQRPATYATRRWHFKTHSFPSGHALGSVAAYGTVAVLLGNYSLVGAVCGGLLAALVMLIGISRVYLGAHYPSDVMAGWLFGAVGALVAASFLLL